MPAFLERKLEQEYRAKGKTGRKLAGYVYGTLNNLGAMHGSKETAKGRAMDRKHEEDMERAHLHAGEPLHESLRGARKPMADLLRKQRRK